MPYFRSGHIATLKYGDQWKKEVVFAILAMKMRNMWVKATLKYPSYVL